MTLVAGFSCGGPPAFVGDLLTSWRVPSALRLPIKATETTFPTGDKTFAAGLAQKLIIVRPYLLIAWAGSASEIHKLVRELNEVLPRSIDELRGCADVLFCPLNELTRDVEVVAVVIDGDSIRPYCVHTRGFELDDRRYYLLGTGSSTAYNFLTEMSRHMPMPDSSEGFAARSLLINFAANALMAQYVSEYGLAEAWGGGFEVAYVSKNRFAKVNNILVRCWSLNADITLGSVGTNFLMHYQDSALLITSFGDIERTTAVLSSLSNSFNWGFRKKIAAEWTVDLFYRPDNGQHYCAVQYEYPWSRNKSHFVFRGGKLTGWKMRKARVDKLVDLIKLDGPVRPFSIRSF
jgi:hypothetical protein